jgi:hypothetical protein
MIVCKNIKALETPEPKSGPETTRIQFRLPDGQRIVRNFAKSDKVLSVFQFVKARAPKACEAPFEVVLS